MPIQLTAELQRTVEALIAKGHYENTETVIEQALRLLTEYEKLRALKSALDLGRNQFAVGQSRPYDHQLFAQLKSDAFERFRAGERAPFDARP